MSSIVHARVMPNRAHDYLYDSNYTVAGAKDHARHIARSQTHDVLIQPSYANMFSTLPHHRAINFTLRSHPLPASLGNDRRTYGGGTQPDVTGASRFKYFRRPIIPYMPSLGTQIVYARRPVVVSGESAAGGAGSGEVDAREPLTRTVAMQTVYRESDTQTDPYSPEYTLHPSCAGSLSQPPELLSLMTLTFAAGLPVTTTELELIERARAKRAWEATLPVVTDQASFEKRLRMMEEMELAEWRTREAEIRRLQSARLKMLQRVIEEREAQNESVAEARVRKVWDRKMLDRDALLERLARRKIKAVRKLAVQRAHVEPRIERRDIIGEYADFGSAVYAPRTRDGVFADTPRVGVKLRIGEGVDGYNALEALSQEILPNLLPSILAPPPTQKSSSLTARRDAQLYAQLELMNTKLKEQHPVNMANAAFFATPVKPLRFAQKVEKPPVRPPTPLIVDPLPEEEAKETSAILLQKLIRGRVAQNMMYQGKQRRQYLISELRTRHSLSTTAAQAPRLAVPPSTRAALRESGGGDDAVGEGDIVLDENGNPIGDEAAEAAARAAAEAAEAADAAEEAAFAEEEARHPGVQVVLNSESPIPAGSEPYTPTPAAPTSTLLPTYVSRTLHHLTTDLLRLREEHRLCALVKLAERTRRMREAAESGTRQAELERRVVEDEVFRQVMGVHRESVQTFLEDVVAGVGERVAGFAARQRVRDYVEAVVRVGQVVEGASRGQSAAERTTVSDLVSSFLIPEVERQTLRNQVKTDQRRYLSAAHRAVTSTLPTVEAAVADRTPAAKSRDDVNTSQSETNQGMQDPAIDDDAAAIDAAEAAATAAGTAGGTAAEAKDNGIAARPRESRPASRSSRAEF
ncbi:Cilia- and flagella-associated protein 91 [Geranomyces variabilis]|uniref:Cilia- and flagella-associated protein 91 n=1 Tax=Geranomyces variabilis TaxID=109894 RepID=A0AAD5XJW5_9FUNG|nr:Cilia- and flagella-associated protein 91 [Geranomyces variabilis]